MAASPFSGAPGTSAAAGGSWGNSGGEIGGHPVLELDTGHDDPALITVCAECGAMSTILFLRRDRWYCTKCRMEGNAPPNLYPVS